MPIHDPIYEPQIKTNTLIIFGKVPTTECGNKLPYACAVSSDTCSLTAIKLQDRTVINHRL